MQRTASRPEYSLKGKTADNTSASYTLSGNYSCFCTFWAGFATSLDFVLFVHVKKNHEAVKSDSWTAAWL